MQMLNLKQNNSKKLKKSQLFFIGSFLIFIGLSFLSWNYLMRIRENVYSDMNIAISNLQNVDNSTDTYLDNVPIANNILDDTGTSTDLNSSSENQYDKYLGILEIPRIGLKRGFYSLDSRYNQIQYNVTLVNGSTMPDVVHGNLILMAHSGDAYISYFAYLYRLNLNDYAYVTYRGVRYQYQLVNVYNVLKNGRVKISRNYDRTTLTLITCTKDNDTLQTVYIFELVS